MPGRKIIWVASLPRTGSMWAYNVARELLRASGRRVLPVEVPHDSEQIRRCATEAAIDTDPTQVWTLKIHEALAPDAYKGSVFITTHRDPRDALVSFIRFMRATFDSALHVFATQGWELERHYRALPASVVLHLDYETMTTAPTRVAWEMAAFLDIELPETDVRPIIDALSKPRVAEQIAAMEAARPTGLRRHARLYDRRTGFQTGHVSDYRDGDWRTILTADQQVRMHEALGGWLREVGYP